MTKLSEALHFMLDEGPLADLRTLEADLEAAHLANQALTARCDRMRTERDAAERERLSAWQVSEGNFDAAVSARKKVDEARAGIAILHLVYEMREHALRRRYMGDCKCIEAQICGGPGDTHTECEARSALDQRAYEHGMADGIGCHQGDHRAMHRRAQAAESRAAKLTREVATLRVRLDGAIAKIPPGDLWRTPEPIVDEECPCVWRDGTRGYPGGCKCGGTGRRPIPPVALEASDGGNRQAEAAARPFPVGEQCMFVRSRGSDGSRQTELVRVVSYDDMRNRVLVRFHEGTKFQREGFVHPNDLEPDPMSDEDLEDLARRRVTERVEGLCGLCLRDEDHCAAIAERDAQIETLTRERDRACAEIEETWEALGTLRRGRGVTLPMRAAHVVRTRSIWYDAQSAAHVARFAAEAERDEAIARAERAERDLAALRAERSR